jgi:hypothetical protein
MPWAEILQPICSVLVNSCINTKCPQLLYAILKANDIAVANYICRNSDFRIKILCFICSNICINKCTRIPFVTASGLELEGRTSLPAEAEILLFAPTPKKSLSRWCKAAGM